MKKNRKYIIWIIALLIIGYVLLDSILYQGVKPEFITEDGFQGNYFAKNISEEKAAIVLIGGGQWFVSSLCWQGRSTFFAGRN